MNRFRVNQSPIRLEFFRAIAIGRRDVIDKFIGRNRWLTTFEL